MMYIVAGLPLLVLSSLAPAAGQPPDTEDIIIRDRLTPIDGVVNFSGSCGPHRYGIELHRSCGRSSLTITVDGHRLQPEEVAKVENAVLPGRSNRPV